ncbi:hypothetical protein [Fodinibius sp. SL11]|uniref:hypothetical protein n=1 Tax=Fodinibius sp. SL11 TaxID=3425690 RepID=UPI003F881402
MDHVVYLDTKANELEKLLNRSKTMIIRGATGRKHPYGRVNEGDILYFIRNNAEGVVKAKGIVESVFNSDKMSTEESVALVKKHQDKLQLSNRQFKKWAGKRYIVLIWLKNIEEVKSFAIDKTNYGNMDDWLPVEKIETVKN